MRRTIAAILIFIVLALGATACGEDEIPADKVATPGRNRPTPAQLQEYGQWIELTRPDGTRMPCYLFSEGSAHLAWLAFDCDWASK